MRLIKQFHNQAYPVFSVYPVLGATEIFARQKRNLWLRNWPRCQSLKIKSHKFPDTKKYSKRAKYCDLVCLDAQEDWAELVVFCVNDGAVA